MNDFPQPAFRSARRSLLKSVAAGFGGVALNAICQQVAASENGTTPFHFLPRAKRVIFMFMKGGPSQVDTFDYKPQLQKDDGKPLPFAKPRGQFAPTGNLLGSPWRFRQYGQSGIPVSELFPNVAELVDDKLRRPDDGNGDCRQSGRGDDDLLLLNRCRSHKTNSFRACWQAGTPGLAEAFHFCPKASAAHLQTFPHTFPWAVGETVAWLT